MAPSSNEDIVDAAPAADHGMTTRESNHQATTPRRSVRRPTPTKRKEMPTSSSTQHQSAAKKVKPASTAKASSPKSTDGRPPTSKSDGISHTQNVVYMIVEKLGELNPKGEPIGSFRPPPSNESMKPPSRIRLKQASGIWTYRKPTPDEGPHRQFGLDVTLSVMYKCPITNEYVRYIPPDFAAPAKLTRLLNCFHLYLCSQKNKFKRNVIDKYVEQRSSKGLVDELKDLFKEGCLGEPGCYLHQSILDVYYNAPAFETDVIDVAMQEGYEADNYLRLEQGKKEQAGKNTTFASGINDNARPIDEVEPSNLSGSTNVSHGQYKEVQAGLPHSTQHASDSPNASPHGATPSSSTGAAAAGGGGGGGVAGHESTDACLSSGPDGQCFGSYHSDIVACQKVRVSNGAIVPFDQASTDDYEEVVYEDAALQPPVHEDYNDQSGDDDSYCPDDYVCPGCTHCQFVMDQNWKLKKKQDDLFAENLRLSVTEASQDAENVILQEKVSKMEQELAALKLPRSSTDAPRTEKRNTTDSVGAGLDAAGDTNTNTTRDLSSQTAGTGGQSQGSTLLLFENSDSSSEMAGTGVRPIARATVPTTAMAGSSTMDPFNAAFYNRLPKAPPKPAPLPLIDEGDKKPATVEKENALTDSSLGSSGTEGTTATTNGEAATHPATTINNSPEDSKKPASSVTHGPAAEIESVLHGTTATDLQNVEAVTDNGAADMDGHDDVEDEGAADMDGHNDVEVELPDAEWGW